jgi:hypothetical protein
MAKQGRPAGGSTHGVPVFFSRRKSGSLDNLSSEFCEFSLEAKRTDPAMLCHGQMEGFNLVRKS